MLAYINNESRRFHVFVSNRVQEIQDYTNSDQWRHVGSKENPADEASRGTSSQGLENSRWILGSEFLWEDESKWPRSDKNPHGFTISQEDPEIKKNRLYGNHNIARDVFRHRRENRTNLGLAQSEAQRAAKSVLFKSLSC